MSTCVFCNSTSDLNTEMNITLEDGSKVRVIICDEHAEDATVKTARAAYQKRQDEIKHVIEQAKALGLNISEMPNGLTLAQSADPLPQTAIEPRSQQPAQPAPQARIPVKNDDIGDDPDVITTDKLDSHPGMRSVGGGTDFGNVESLSSHDVNAFKEKLPEDARKGVAKMGIAEGREGQPIIIPKKRRDGTGTTTINIIKIDDRHLQESFKRMAGDSMNGKVPDFARSGYQNTTRTCPICRGEGEVNNQECPKCKGNGIISVY